MIDKLDPQQQLLDTAKECGFLLGCMADSVESSHGDYGEVEALLTMSIDLIEAARAYEAMTSTTNRAPESESEGVS